MNLQLLHAGPCLTTYYDSHNDWLFADWQGDLTLPGVQAACLELTRCYQRNNYPRVLNSNALVTSISRDVTPWLAQEFVPVMEFTGVRQLAWVCAPALGGRYMAQEIANREPTRCLTLFSDLEEAVAWLQRTRTDYSSGCARPLRLPTTQARLDEAVQRLAQCIAAYEPARLAPTGR
ncbi:hypothetical protein QMK33_21150 [Hymenobacter sp. H14-R3]|uniref:hypothetical protein n=1 Tax=Hymenobacter sp. H14-R3 TaxID=3046308 RepID=UPI0024B8C398|nr:hypothetical protein [Hymenobacter sp. H14-R3]MDJ0367661.1 hypothetical protein [Hymenobacter sp. H14-R3]